MRTHAASAEGSALIYASFRQRLFANIVDFIIWSPLILLQWPGRLSKTDSITVAVAGFVANVAYQVAMHARFGRTVGKMVARIQVVSMDAQPIGWREATLRHSVTFALGLVSGAAYVTALLGIPDASWSSNAEQQARLMQESLPLWGRAADVAMQAWIWSEVVVVLFNEKKRAPHDFLAGTVVVELPEAPR